MNKPEGLRARVEAAGKVGLPLELVGRLRGETPGELEKDAEALLRELGRPPSAGQVRRDAKAYPYDY